MVIVSQSLETSVIFFPVIDSYIELQILSLKCEGYQFPKNTNALPIEQYCKQHFFGPLVVALQTETAPPVL